MKWTANKCSVYTNCTSGTYKNLPCLQFLLNKKIIIKNEALERSFGLWFTNIH